MRIGIPRETKLGERRVILDPAGVAALVADGHEVRVESGAGAAVGHDDDHYARAGAQVVPVTDAWGAELVLKVKEVQDADIPHLRRGQAIFGFHHLVGEPRMTRWLAAQSITAIAFELVRDSRGVYPLLAPMSVIAGRMAPLVGAQGLMRPDGCGTLLASLAGVAPAKVLVLGGGHAAANAAEVALSLGAEVALLTRTQETCDKLSRSLHKGPMGSAFSARVSTPGSVERHALEADLVVGAVFIPGAPTPKLLPRSLVRRMKRGSVIVDISIDAGGVAETSRPTTHADPFFVEEGVLHYCVGNMPAAVPRAAAAALARAALPYARALAGAGVAEAVRDDPSLRAAVVLWKGRVTHEGIAAESALPFAPLVDADFPARAREATR